MAGFMLSPGVQVVEKDLTSIVPAVSTSVGAYAGVFSWGPVMEPTTVSSENELVKRFGGPTDSTATSFFSAANFLSYSNNLIVTRVDTNGNRNAVATQSGSVTTITVGTPGTGYAAVPTVTLGAPNISGGQQATATAVVSGVVTATTVSAGGAGYTTPPIVTFSAAPAGGTTATGTAVLTGDAVTGITITSGGSGYLTPPTITLSGGGGNNAAATATLTYSVTGATVSNAGSGYTSAPSVTFTAAPGGGTTAVGTAAIATGGVKINNRDVYDATYANGAGVVGPFAAKYPGAAGNALRVSMADSATYATWTYKDEFDSAPNAKELHVLVMDDTGAISGTAGTILEKFAFLSKASDGKRSDGTSTYYKQVLNETSAWVYWMDHPTGMDWGKVDGPAVTFTALSAAINVVLAGGVDDFVASDANLQNGFALFADDEKYDISLVVAGKATAATAAFIVNNVAEVRKDCIVFVSPQNTSTGEPIVGSDTATADGIIAYKAAMNVTSSYAVMDSGFKYQYDRYNDKYRWVPLNADVAGLCARTDFTDDPWFSPAGYNRGQVKNVVKLAYNPNKTARDNLYKNGINSVVSFPGQGTVLFGDKTMLARPSAFDRINVRRLFIVLEKAIATAAKFQLFEFNDQFTRAQFRSIVEPFLRDVQGRRGVTDFRVKCDETNNTAEVIDSNRFVADIFIKPARSINFITLNFIAARSGVSFEEIGG